MTVYYVGPGGNDGNSGLTWALRKLTLNGCEDVPVVAGDTVYVGPGVYREQLTVDVSGGAGTEITYIGDVSGENTDDVGGIVRITGSDNDQTTARSYAVLADDKDYRVFRGFTLDTTSSEMFRIIGGSTNWTIEDCSFITAAVSGVYTQGTDQADHIIRRCLFFGIKYNAYAIYFRETAGIQDAGHLVQNCVFVGDGSAVVSEEVGGFTVRNCLALATYYGVRVIVALPVGYTTITVENCNFSNNNYPLVATVLGEITEDYNNFWQPQAARTNVGVGGNSQVYTPLFLPPILHSGASQASGFKFPWWTFSLSEWSPLRAITGNSEPTVDFWAIPRPTTASKNSWGACQFQDVELEDTTVQAGSYARVLNDAGAVLVRRVPCTNVSTTVTLYMRYEANYAGNLPRMIIKQPGASDRATVMTAAANTWEQLSDTFTPNASPGYFEIWAESRNTNGANDKVFYDSLVVS